MDDETYEENDPAESTDDCIPASNEISTLSEEELRDCQKRFVDDYPDGKVTKAQLGEVYRNYYPNGKVDALVKYFFDVLDADGNGYIDFEEFLLGNTVLNSGDINARLGFVFEMYDTTGDEKISEKEVERFIHIIFDVHGETNRQGDNDPKYHTAEIFRRFDTDGDGFLSKEEFMDGIKNDPAVRELLRPTL